MQNGTAVLLATNSSHNVTGTLPTEPHVYMVTHYVLAGCYFALTLFTLGLVVFKCANSTLREMWKVLFFSFVILGSAMRGCWAVFDPMMLNETILISNRIDLFLNLFPSALFFSCYLVLLFLWIEVYHYPRASGMRIYHVRVHLWVVTGSMMAIFLILFLVDLLVFPSDYVTVSSPSNVVERVLILYVASLYVLCCSAFFIYGLLVLVPLCRKPERRRDTLLRILGLTMLIVCIFLVRAAFVFIGFFSNWSFVSYFDLVYYCSTEILPICAMFFILLWRAPPARVPEALHATVVHDASSGSSVDDRTPLWRK